MPRNTHPASATSTNPPTQRVQRDIEAIVSWIMLLAMIVVNTLAQTGVLTRNAVHSSNVFTWFEPEQYVQLIWIPIYILLAIWLIRIRRGAHKAHHLARIPFTLIGILFIAACAIDIGWILAWTFVNYPLAVTLVIIQTLLVGIIWFFARRQDNTLWNTAPFILWGTWMMVETIINIARAVTYYVSKDGNISNSAQSISTIVLVIILLAAAWLMNVQLHDWLFGLVVLWSVIGIAFRLMDTSRLTAGIIIALAAAAAVITYLPWQRLANRMPQSTPTPSSATINTSATPITPTATPQPKPNEIIDVSTASNEPSEDSSNSHA